jgi:hypothetical protein
MSRKVTAAFALAVAIGVGAVFLLLNGAPTVTVKNVSDETLHAVVVHVTGAAYDLGDIGAGESRSVRVSPTGESHVEIQHAQGRLVVGTYFEGGYRGHINVDVTPRGVVRVEDKVRIGPV